MVFELDNGGSYTKSFGSMPDGMCYLDAMKGYDMRKDIRKGMMDVVKAQSISGLSAGTTDLSLIPIYVDPSIVDVTRRLTPLVELIPRVTNYGRTADFNQLTQRGYVGFRPEDAALNESDDTYVRSSVPIKFNYMVGRVTGPMLSASRQYLSAQYIDALNLEVRNKTISLRYNEENILVNGNAGTNPNEFTGILNYTGLQETDLTGAAISIADLRSIIRKARTANDSATLGQGDPNLIVTDFTSLDNTKSLLQEFQRYVGTNDIAWGIRAIEFEGLPMIASKWMPTTPTQRKLMVLQTDTLQMRVLQDVTYEDLAKTNDSYKFLLKCYEALIVTAPQFNARLINIA
jgi:hypothetical protein